MKENRELKRTSARLTRTSTLCLGKLSEDEQKDVLSKVEELEMMEPDTVDPTVVEAQNEKIKGYTFPPRTYAISIQTALFLELQRQVRKYQEDLHETSLKAKRSQKSLADQRKTVCEFAEAAEELLPEMQKLEEMLAVERQAKEDLERKLESLGSTVCSQCWCTCTQNGLG